MSMIPIASTTVGAGGTSTITFSNIPSTFTHLQIRVFGKSSRTGPGDDYQYLRFNSDTGSNYSYHELYGQGSSVTSAGGANSIYIYAGYVMGNYTGTTSMFSNHIIDILDYANTNKNKTVRTIGGVDTNNVTTTTVGIWSGAWRNTNAIDTITLSAGTSPYLQYSRFDLYGITNSPATGA